MCTRSSTILPMYPFRFGVQLKHANCVDDWLGVVSKLERLGFGTVTLPDHIDDSFAPLSSLGYLAAKTSLKIGTMVVSNDLRNPLLLAREAATLALLSKGRFELGIGAGWQESDYSQLGITMDSPKVRVDRLEESLELITTSLLQSRFSFSGSYYEVSEFQLYPSITPDLLPKILVGGGGPPVLSLAARFADIVSINPSLRLGEYAKETLDEMSEASYQQKSTLVQAKLDEFGRKAELHCRSAFVYVGDDHHKVVKEVATQLGVDVKEAYRMPPVLVGTVESIVEQLEMRRERFGFSYWSIHEDDVDSFAPVVAALRGH